MLFVSEPYGGQLNDHLTMHWRHKLGRCELSKGEWLNTMLLGDTNLTNWMMKIFEHFYSVQSVGGWKKLPIVTQWYGMRKKNVDMVKFTLVTICTYAVVHWGHKKFLVIVKFTSLRICTCAVVHQDCSCHFAYNKHEKSNKSCAGGLNNKKRPWLIFFLNGSH